MDDVIFNKLDAMGANTQEGINRLMGNKELYARFLKKFVDANHADEIRQALKDRNYDDLLLHTHTNKGTTGNLSLTPLYDRYAIIVSEIRAQNYSSLAKKISEVLKLQDNMCNIIKGLE